MISLLDVLAGMRNCPRASRGGSIFPIAIAGQRANQGAGVTAAIIGALEVPLVWNRPHRATRGRELRLGGGAREEQPDYTGSVASGPPAFIMEAHRLGHFLPKGEGGLPDIVGIAAQPFVMLLRSSFGLHQVRQPGVGLLVRCDHGVPTT